MSNFEQPITSTPVTEVLESLHIPYRLFHHQEQITSLENAAKKRGQRPNQIVRSIVFRVSPGEYILVLAAGPSQIDWRGLRNYLGRSRLTMASKEEILDATGYPLGAVSPLGLPHPMRTLVDISVLDQVEISIGSGIRGLAVILQSSDLLKALPQYDIVDLVKPGSFG